MILMVCSGSKLPSSTEQFHKKLKLVLKKLPNVTADGRNVDFSLKKWEWNFLYKHTNGGYLFVSKNQQFNIRVHLKTRSDKNLRAVDLTFVYRRKSSLGWFGVPERSDLGDGYEVRVDKIVGNFTDVFRFY